DPEAANELLGFGERAVDDGGLSAFEVEADAVAAGPQTFASFHNTRFDELFVEFAHVREQPGAGEVAGFVTFVAFDDDHESHCESPWRCGHVAGAFELDAASMSTSKGWD